MKKTNFHPYLPLLIIFLLGISLSSVAFFLFRTAEWQRRQEEFTASARGHGEIIEDALVQNFNVLRAIGSFFNASTEVSREEFKIFTRVMLRQNPNIVAVSWMPRVASSGIEDFAERLQKDGFGDIRLEEMDEEGQRNLLKPADEYFFTEFVEPLEENSFFLGLDISHNSIRRSAMDIARDSGEVVMSERIKLLRGRSDDYGCRLFFPVYGDEIQDNPTIEDRRQYLRGYVSVLFWIGRTVESCLRPLDYSGIILYLYDLGPQNRDLLWFYGSKEFEGKSGNAFSAEFSEEAMKKITRGIHFSRIVSLGMQEWGLLFLPTRSFFSGHRLWQSRVILITGILITCFLVIFLYSLLRRDIQIKRLVEEQTRQLRNLTQAVEQSPAVVMITDPHGKIEYINPKFTQVTGFSLEEVKGKNPRILKSGDLPFEVYRQMWQEISLGREWRGQFHNKRKNGSFFWEAASISTIRSPDGVVTHYIKVAEDITLRKEAEEKLALAKEDLEKKNRELQRLDQLKSEFVSTVSHELRTPLSITKEGIALVLDRIPGELNAKQNQILNTAKDNIDRLARLINELLDISKIEAGRVVLKKQFVDFSAVLCGVVNSFEALARAKGIVLNCSSAAPQVTAYVDPDRISQVLTNLIGNAVKFIKQGTVEVSVRDTDTQIECRIIDTGPGISEVDMPKLFQKFQQFDRVAGPGEKGTGLGLSIAQAIVQMHKGEIRGESILGKGSEFTFLLPHYTLEEAFKESVESSIAEAKKQDITLSLIIFSLREFSSIPQERLRVLLQEAKEVVAEGLRRSGDIVFDDHTGIAVLLPGCDKESAVGISRRLAKTLEEFISQQKLPEGVGVYAGNAVFPDDAMTTDELLTKARRPV
ncbi:MAG: CHASE domain-containing protein [Candidatus Omnitrophica bacterium]|nr:CHASE domain-containing protein [Candidatus Omnitrophota bacterium]